MENYRRKKVVGRGAYGTVFLCSKVEDQKEVIIKHIPVEGMTKNDRQATVNEIRVLSMLDHPNIIKYYDSFLQDHAMMIVMEFAPGGTLADLLEEKVRQSDGKIHERLVIHSFMRLLI